MVRKLLGTKNLKILTFAIKFNLDIVLKIKKIVFILSAMSIIEVWQSYVQFFFQLPLAIMHLILYLN